MHIQCDTQTRANWWKSLVKLSKENNYHRIVLNLKIGSINPVTPLIESTNIYSFINFIYSHLQQVHVHITKFIEFFSRMEKGKRRKEKEEKSSSTPMKFTHVWFQSRSLNFTSRREEIHHIDEWRRKPKRRRKKISASSISFPFYF